MLKKTPEEIVMSLDTEEWIVVRKTFSEGVRYLLQIRRVDAIKPYWLTQQIFMSRKRAEMALRHVVQTGVMADTRTT
jgi:hypothetical protein